MFDPLSIFVLYICGPPLETGRKPFVSHEMRFRCNGTCDSKQKRDKIGVKLKDMSPGVSDEKHFLIFNIR